MNKPVLRKVFDFSELVLISNRSEGRASTTWYIHCPECGGDHMFRKTGSKVWHTSCWKTGVEWTVTPREYYIQRPLNLEKLLGEA